MSELLIYTGYTNEFFISGEKYEILNSSDRWIVLKDKNGEQHIMHPDAVSYCFGTEDDPFSFLEDGDFIAQVLIDDAITELIKANLYYPYDDKEHSLADVCKIARMNRHRFEIKLVKFEEEQ